MYRGFVKGFWDTFERYLGSFWDGHRMFYEGGIVGKLKDPEADKLFCGGCSGLTLLSATHMR